MCSDLVTEMQLKLCTQSIIEHKAHSVMPYGIKQDLTDKVFSERNAVLQCVAM